MTEDIEIITKESTLTGFNYKESTSLSDIDETIIWKAELNILIFGNDLSGIYNKSGLSSKKRKRDINICECDSSVFIAWKKNVTNFSSRIATAANKNFLNKPIQFLVKYKKYRYIYYIYIKYFISYFDLRTRKFKKKR